MCLCHTLGHETLCRSTYSTLGFPLIAPSSPSLTGCHVPVVSQGMMLSSAWAGWWCCRVTSGSTKPRSALLTLMSFPITQFQDFSIYLFKVTPFILPESLSNFLLTIWLHCWSSLSSPWWVLGKHSQDSAVYFQHTHCVLSHFCTKKGWLLSRPFVKEGTMKALLCLHSAWVF